MEFDGWEDTPLFTAKIEAWANGPVVPALYDRHRGRYRLDSWSWGDPTRLKESEKSTINAVIDFYGDKTGQWLSELTHREAPWRDARAGLSPGERGHREISHAALAEYYGGLVGVDE